MRNRGDAYVITQFPFIRVVSYARILLLFRFKEMSRPTILISEAPPRNRMQN